MRDPLAASAVATLGPGDRVRLVSPASPVTASHVERQVGVLKSLGLVVERGITWYTETVAAAVLATRPQPTDH